MYIKYSIIVPIYNSEKTLCRCIDSLTEEERKDVEIILVNDGSIDQSDCICDRYRKSNENIIYIKKMNGGVSSARNAGIDIVRGEYMLFVDSDDYVEKKYFSELDALTDSINADWIQFSVKMFDGNNYSNLSMTSFCTKSEEEYATKIGSALCNKSINSPCAKLYKSEILKKNNIRFDERISIGEDKLFNIRYALCAKSCAISEKCLYVVSTENKNSLSRNFTTDYNEQFNLLDNEIRKAVYRSNVSNEFKSQLIKSQNFCICRGIYHEAKLQHLKKTPLLTRIKLLHSACKKISEKKYEFPNTIYCKLIVFPIKYKFCLFIDFFTQCLLKGIIKRR